MKSLNNFFRLYVLINIYGFFVFAQEQLGSDIDGEAAEDISGYNVSLDSVGYQVAIGAFPNDGNA